MARYHGYEEINNSETDGCGYSAVQPRNDGLQKQREHAPTQPQRLRLPDVLTNEERYRRILGNHLPAQAVDWVYGYLDHYKVHFHITRERMSKLGDYRCPTPDRNFHEISINGDLNPWFFLWVFLHEAAHLETHMKHKNVQPHGHEWQEEYRQLIIAHTDIYPSEVQALLKRYTRRIPLSHPVGKQIEAALHRYDPDYNPDRLTLDQLSVGTRFRLVHKPEMLFETIAKRRTRWLCREVSSGRQYLVNGSAEVTIEC